MILGVTPFNFPTMVPLWMFPLALAAGNSFILKPSEKDPMSSMFIAELFNQTAAPKGLLNVINGDGSTVQNLVKNSKIKAISFVGSTPVAKQIFENSAKFGKRCQALGGSKKSCISFRRCKYRLCNRPTNFCCLRLIGQRCMALSVAMVSKK